MEPSGEVSVIPHACTMVSPWRSSNARIIDGGHAEPPLTRVFRLDTSRGRASSSASSPCQMVGTPAVNVGRSASIISASGAGCRKRSGISIDAPAMKAACGRPQAFTWNIGTTGRQMVAGFSPNASAPLTWRECRYTERWL